MVTVTTTHGGIRDLFGRLVAPDVVEAHDQLLAHHGCAKDEAEALLGSSLVRALSDSGMAHLQPHSAARHRDAAADAISTAGPLLIRAPVITAALREYFEMLWDRGTR